MSGELRQRRRRRRRLVAEEAARGAWYPRYFWPSFAVPAVLWQAVFLVGALYMILAIAFGTVDIFRNPVPVLQPWYWNASQVGSVVRMIVSPAGLYRPIYLRTFLFVLIAASACLIIGYTVAYFIAFHAGRRRNLFIVLVVAPIWISYVMRMYAWQGLLLQDGFVNRVLGLLPWVNHPINWLGGKPFTVVVGLIYGYLPYLILPIFGQLTRIDPALIEAAADLGANRWRSFVRVTLPQSKPGILAGLMIITLPMMGDYFTNTMISGSPRTVMIGNIIDNSVNLPGLGGLGAIVALTLVAILFIPMIWYMRTTRVAGLVR